MVASMIGVDGINRQVLRVCFLGRACPVIGQPLFLEYEDVLARPHLTARSPLSGLERRELLEAFLSICDWVDVYFGWRPNLPDEGDNHLIELAVAAQAEYIVTNNISDLSRGELRFPNIQIVRPQDFMKQVIP